jgi:hypothetical protein
VKAKPDLPVFNQRHTATVRHGDKAESRKHTDTGIDEAWEIALDQMFAYTRKM